MVTSDSKPSRPSTFTEYKRQQKAAWRAANPEKARRQNLNGKAQQTRPFKGVDGEGYNLEVAQSEGEETFGRHVYNMLRAGDELLLPTEDKICLSTWECLDFLAALDPRPIYVAYFFDYDVTKILEDISWYKLKKLIDRDSRRGNQGQTFPVDLKDGLFRIDYMPRKFFKVCKRLEEAAGPDGKPKYSKWITINDVGPFFQCKFHIALGKWNIGSEEQRAAIEYGKNQRNSHRLEDVERIKEYNALEIRLLERLMEDFRAACVKVGYVPRKWQGPGQIAEVMLSMNGIAKSRDIPMLTDPANQRLLEFARNAFYGGRPETTGVGPFPGPVYQYDINSAYPYALTHAPCLIHGAWEHAVGENLPIAPMSLCYGSFHKRDEPKRPVLYGLPFRTEKGVIMYPETGKGWYWGFEILAAIHQEFNALESFTYVESCGCMPFSFIRKTYAMRRQMGKDGAGTVLKLALNSLYGKMAQSIGSPKYSNPIWASFITAFCRTQIQDLIHKGHSPHEWGCGHHVAMIATDAIFTCQDLGIRESDELGGFSKEVHPDGIFIIQPGLYFGSSVDSRSGEIKGPKTRGVPQDKVLEHRNKFESHFERMRANSRFEDGDVPLPVRTFVGIRQALHRNNRGLLGQWVETTKNITFDWTNKRQIKFVRTDDAISHIMTFPHFKPPQEETTPYSKDIGALFLEMELDRMDQPDWSDVAFMMGDEV